MTEYSFERVKDMADPKRCQAVTGSGQCINKSVNESSYCPVHGGYHNVTKEVDKLKNYRLEKFRFRQLISDHSNSAEIKNLRDEIGISRMTMEVLLNRCKDDHELILYLPQISDLTMKIERLVSSCHKIEQNMGQLLDKTILLNFASQVIDIINEHIDDDQKKNLIANQIVESLSSSNA